MQIIESNLGKTRASLTHDDLVNVANLLIGFSASDVVNVIRDAAKLPLKRLIKSGVNVETAKSDMMGPVTADDFLNVLKDTKSSVNQGSLSLFRNWNKE